MAASGSGGKEPGERPWTATSTWAAGPGGGAVEDAVSFETSEDDAEAAPAGVVLLCPPPDGDGGVPPCEVTVSFRGKYEIHRVYVRSTARIYELYHCTDKIGTSKDYLCTVRCGLAVKEPQPCGEESTSRWSGSALTSNKREHEAKSVSSGSDEDSWVDVTVPESPVGNNTPETQERNVIPTCQENTLAHYEATAEMTDVSPCVSLTIRLVSLKSKTSVHIDEIYIFADPVESTNDDSAAGTGNMGGNSLLAMLVPGLMQMSKSRNMKIDNSYFSDGSRTQLTQDPAMKEISTCEKVTQEARPCSTNDSKYKPAGIESGMSPTVGGTVSNEESNQGELQFKDLSSFPLPVQTIGSTQAPSVKDQRALNTGHLANPLVNETFTPYNHIEKKLDTLLSKIEKVELYCSRFEDNMIKPLSSIEARLHHLEEQFSSFSVDIQSLQGPAVMSVPYGMSNTVNSQGGAHNDASDRTPASTTDRKPGLAVRAPDFPSDDSYAYNVANENHVNVCGPNVVPRVLVKVPSCIAQPELTGGNLHDGAISPVDCTLSSEKEHKTSPGLAVKVPEFLDDDDDDNEEEEVEEDKEAEVCDDDGHTWNDDTLSKSTADNSKSKKPLSINGALASALEALLISTKGTASSKHVVCTASDLSAKNIQDSFSCSLSSENNSEMSTKDGSADQFFVTSGDANLVGVFISSQETDATAHNSLSEEILDSKVETIEQNDSRGPEKVSFVACTESLDVPSQTHTVEESIDDEIQIDIQRYGHNLDTMPYAVSAGPLDSPKLPTVFEAVDNGVKVNENKPSISLAEFLAARNGSSFNNGTSEVCCSKGGAEELSFERTSAGAGKSLKNISHLLVKKALEVDADERELFSTALNLDEGFSKHNAEHSGSCLSSMALFSGAPGKEPVVSANATSGNCVDDLLAGIGDRPAPTPISGEELQMVCDFLCEFNDDMSGTTSTAKGKSKRGPSLDLEALLAESSDSEAQISDLEDTDCGASIGSARLFGTFSSSDDNASAVDEPLIDVADLTTASEPDICARSNPLVDVADLTNPSGINADSVNDPSADVVDLPNPSEAYASDVINEPLVSVDDLPKSLEMFSGGSCGDHPDSLI